MILFLEQGQVLNQFVHNEEGGKKERKVGKPSIKINKKGKAFGCSEAKLGILLAGT